MKTPTHRTLAAAISLLLITTPLAGCGAKKPVSAPAPAPAPTETARPAEPAPAPAPAPAPPAPKIPQLPGAIGIMVENEVHARPQAGLDQADLVYEMEAEGGITRFLAYYYTNKADKVGPVRSARMGFYDIAYAYGAPYAHAGGNYDVLNILERRDGHLLNVDEIYTAGYAFWRSTDRKAPHNLYTSTDKVVGRAKDTGFSLKPLAAFATGEARGAGQKAETISFSWGPRTQGVEWTWNGKRYQRSQDGEPHLLEGGVRVEADNVVMLFTRFVWDGKAQDGDGQYNISIVGSGSGYLFRGGQVYPIKWSKPSRDEHYQLTTPDGQSVLLAPGQTWFEVLKSKEHVVRGLPE